MSWLATLQKLWAAWKAIKAALEALRGMAGGKRTPEKTGHHDEYPPKYDPQKDHPADQAGG